MTHTIVDHIYVLDETVILAGDPLYQGDNVRLDQPAGILINTADAMATMHRLTVLADAHDASLIVNPDKEFRPLLSICPEPTKRLSERDRCFWRSEPEVLYGVSPEEGVITP